MAAIPSSQKYAPLAAFLTALPATAPTVTLTLTEIEHLIGTALPAGASTQTWWTASRGRSRPQPWAMAGWRVVGASMRTATPVVTFARVVVTSRARRAAPGAGAG